MQHKTLDDIQRVIALDKPRAVIDQFIDDYLAGISLAPFYAAEREFAELTAQPDRDPEPAVLDEDDKVLIPAVDYNAIRDARLAELSASYPCLADPGAPRPEPVRDYSLVADLQREIAKAERTRSVERITVTTTAGNEFDGDETSQQRMARALLVSQETGQTETEWVLADNSVAVIGRDELAEALALAMQAQAALWFI